MNHTVKWKEKERKAKQLEHRLRKEQRRKNRREIARQVAGLKPC